RSTITSATRTESGQESATFCRSSGVRADVRESGREGLDAIPRCLYTVRSEYAETRLSPRLARSARAKDPLAAAAPAWLRHHVCDSSHVRRSAPRRGRFTLS